jgi:diguanylate cyclase
MTHHASDESSRRGKWWQWFAGEDPDGGDEQGATSPTAAALAHEPTAREIWLPAKRRMLAKVADFLIDHDLEVLPGTLAVAYDCVTGADPRLSQLILERAEKGLPITIKWLEDAKGISDNGNDGPLVMLMGRIEESLTEFSSTMSGARSATSEYSSAMQRHVDDLQQANKAGEVISELAALTRAMMDRTRAIEHDLAQSEKRIEALQGSLEETRRVADMDHLTGLPNRRAFEVRLEREVKEAGLTGEPLSVAFCDIDHFKRINDTHGHPAGDRVLKVVAETLNRISDVRCHVARHGGEEFAVLFRNHTVDQAFTRLDLAREEIAERRLVNRGNDTPFGQITFSAGIADVFGYADQSAALKAADEALYAAKTAGRNRILTAGSLPEQAQDAA